MFKSLYDYCAERDEFELLVQWDKEKNKGISPRDISYGSHRKIWWVCPLGHQWQSVVYTRTGQKSGCPYCAGKKVLPFSRTLSSRYPQLADEWHPTKNNGLSLDDFPPATHRKVWWKCRKGHEWKAQIDSRTRGAGCPVCANRLLLKGENDLATTHPNIARQWHKEKNGVLTPCDVVAGRHSKVWWQCDFGHEWQATILSRTANGNGCPVCAGKTVVSGDNDLLSMFPQIASQWHPTLNGSKTPQSVTAFSNARVWWICDKGHAFKGIIAHRTQSGTDCPYCTNRKVLAGFNDLQTKEPQIAAQWHPELNGTLTPQMVTTGSRKKVWWKCPNGHVWKTVVYSRTTARKSGCPVCAGKVKESRQMQYEEFAHFSGSKTGTDSR